MDMDIDATVQSAAGPGWYFDDAVPGRLLDHPNGRTITASEHVWLAWVTGNSSDVHGNADRAAGTEFGHPIVLGALTIAIVIGLAAPGPGTPAQAGSVEQTAWKKIRLVRPVRAGDTIRAASRIIGATEAPIWGPGGWVDRTITGRSTRGDTVVVIEERCWVPSREDMRERLGVGVDGPQDTSGRDGPAIPPGWNG